MEPAVEKYRRLMAKADEYHKRALWQEKLHMLQEALAICGKPGFPEPLARRQDLLYDLGAIRRRLGQYEEAERVLHEAIDIFPEANSIKLANVLGELAVVLRHASRFEEARNATQQQFLIAKAAPEGLLRDVELCRSIGNEGMVNYNMACLDEYALERSSLLELAFAQLHERVERARSLQQHLTKTDPTSRWLAMARAWETIGLDRLTLCHVAAGRFPDAVATAEDSQRRQPHIEPTISAQSRFYYGYALWHSGLRDDAKSQWNAPHGTCSSPIVFCKEPSQEHNGYLKLMADAEVDFDTYDEQGFSALDYAVLSESAVGREAIPIVVQTLRTSLRKRVMSGDTETSQSAIDAELDQEISRRLKQAEVRRQYRKILQETIRPQLRALDRRSFNKLRDLHAEFLLSNDEDHRVFSTFKFIAYSDFAKHGELPRSDAGIAREFSTSNAARSQLQSQHVNFIIFFSYRWIGGNRPDDESKTQWKRIMNAMEQFLQHNDQVQADNLGIWLDYACIDQEDEKEKERGVDALPLAVLLCNAMVSLVDSTYYERAWCGLEVILMQALLGSYELHQWWEHRLDSPNTDRSQGSLHTPEGPRHLDVSKLKLTKEALDRPKVDFLIRQSKLLGKDDA